MVFARPVENKVYEDSWTEDLEVNFDKLEEEKKECLAWYEIVEISRVS